MRTSHHTNEKIGSTTDRQRINRMIGSRRGLTVALSMLIGLGLIVLGPDRPLHTKEASGGGEAIGDIAEATEPDAGTSFLGDLFGVPGADASTPTPEVWFGAPSYSQWPDKSGCSGARYPSAACSWPTVHHTFYYGDPYRGDWGIDIGGMSAGEQVKLYAAPQDTRYNSATTAHVLRAIPACSAAHSGESRASRVARGGHAVVIQLRVGSTKIGTLKFVHVQPKVQAGQRISRWGGLVGTVGSYKRNSCWTGPHVHFEATNYARYSCWNRSWAPGASMKPSNFMGFLGGSRASAPRQPCP